MAGGGAAQHTTGASQEMTQAGPDTALAEETTLIPSVSPHDTSADNLANSGLGARAEDDTAVAMEDEIMSQERRESSAGWRVGVQGSTPRGLAKHQGQCHLADPSCRPAHPGALCAADLPDLDLKKCHVIGLGAVGPMLTLLH